MRLKQVTLWLLLQLTFKEEFAKIFKGEKICQTISLDLSVVFWSSEQNETKEERKCKDNTPQSYNTYYISHIHSGTFYITDCYNIGECTFSTQA